MPIDYSLLKFSKGTPKALAKDARDNAREADDERENVKVRARSGGRCEVYVGGRRCNRRAFEVHHLMGGRGVRGRGESARAARKQHTCSVCHSAITSHRLQRIGASIPEWTDRYKRLG